MPGKELAKAASNVVSVHKKYTLQPHGIWSHIQRFLAVDPNRSSGIPLNPQYRNPPPGSNPPDEYDDPTTFPASDIAENPYYRRDTRRAYPRLSFVNQADVVGLLSVGSKATPKPGRELIGEQGAKELMEVKKEGEQFGLARLLEQKNGKGEIARLVLGEDGLPPFPSGVTPGVKGGRRYELTEGEGYPEK
ncbi:MAG: hypothetical protein M1823_004274 [Watsoniomyces obsoletus]|nr:MAG: hypothetical protein M1823_004274 [Watsoniomyces obsoletus]